MKNPFTFIDLFAGIGGFRLALEKLGGRCVFSSEWDKNAQQTYAANFGETPFGDITREETKAQIPDSFDVLCAGFPCQAFSIAGKQKGFEDTRGTLFFEIAQIIEKHQPKVVFLENVKNLLRHDGGRTLSVIVHSLEQLGYKVFYKVLNTSHFSLPQNRERVYFVAFHQSIDAVDFRFPEPSHQSVCLKDFLEEKPDVKTIVREDIEIYKDYSAQQTLFSEYPNKPIQIGKVNKGGQGERIYHPLGHAVTLSAYGGGVGAKTGLYLIDEKIRKLSPRECARVQGFPDDFKLHSSQTQAYKQFGNSVSINVLTAIFSEINKILENNSTQVKYA